MTGLWKVVRLCTSTQLLFCSVPNQSALSSTSLCKPARSTSRTWQESIPYGWRSWLLIITKHKSDLTWLVKHNNVPRDKFCILINFTINTSSFLWCLGILFFFCLLNKSYCCFSSIKLSKFERAIFPLCLIKVKIEQNQKHIYSVFCWVILLIIQLFTLFFVMRDMLHEVAPH